MKTKLSLIIVLLLLSFSMNAQVKNDNKKKTTDEVTFIVNMHCQGCKERIEKYIPLEKGVKDLKVNLGKKEVTVTYKPNKTTVEKLIKAIEELGYNCKEK